MPYVCLYKPKQALLKQRNKRNSHFSLFGAKRANDSRKESKAEPAFSMQTEAGRLQAPPSSITPLEAATSVNHRRGKRLHVACTTKNANREVPPIGQPSLPSGGGLGTAPPLFGAARAVIGRPVVAPSFPAKNAPPPLWDDSASPWLPSLFLPCASLASRGSQSATSRTSSSSPKHLWCPRRALSWDVHRPPPASSVALQPRRSRNPPRGRAYGDLEVASEPAQR